MRGQLSSGPGGRRAAPRGPALLLAGHRAVGLDDHALARHDRAGGLDAPHLLDLDQAHAAARERGQVVVVAEVGDVDPRLDRGVQDRLALGRLDLAAVDRQLDLAPPGFSLAGVCNRGRDSIVI